MTVSKTVHEGSNPSSPAKIPYRLEVCVTSLSKGNQKGNQTDNKLIWEHRNFDIFK